MKQTPEGYDQRLKHAKTSEFTDNLMTDYKINKLCLFRTPLLLSDIAPKVTALGGFI